jgi:capsular exopolysaccharide synthesis family protein
MSKLEDSIERAVKLRDGHMPAIIREASLPASPLRWNSEKEEKQPHLRDYLDILLKRKLIVIAFFVPVVITVTLVSFIMKPLYQSSVTIQLGAENPAILDFKNLYGDTLGSEYYETQFNILKSNALAIKVVERLPEAIEKEFIASKRTFSLPFGSTKGDEKDQRRWRSAEAREKTLTNFLVNKIEVVPIKKSQLVNINFLSYDPASGANVANTIADEYVKFSLESRLEPTQQAKNRLEKEVEDMRTKLESSEGQFNEYMKRNNLFFFNKEQNYESVLTQKLSIISRELDQATAERLSKEALYQEVRKPGNHYNVILANPLIQTLTKEYITQETEYIRLLNIHKPDYPKMLRLKEQIEKIKSNIEAEERKIINALDSDYKIAVKKEGYLASAIEDLHKDVTTIQNKMGQMQMLQRGVETNRELYGSLLQRLKEVGVSTALTESKIQILDRAEVPGVPFKPNKPFNIALSVIFGLFGGVMLAFFVEYFDRTIKTPDDVEKGSPIPLLGMVPLSDEIPEKLIYVNSTNNEAFTEAFRSLSTYIQFANISKPPKQILITSPLQGEGKTLLSVNAAMSLVNFLGRGIIIDADFRRPKVHTFFGLDNSKGLSSLLSGVTDFDGTVKKSPHPGLDVITSGSMPSNPAQILNSPRMRELIKVLSAKYDYVIIDSAPVLGMSDSLILSVLVESVILVVKSGSTPSEALTQTYKLLNNVNAKILGVVVNGVGQKTKYGYSSNYTS